MNVTLVDLCHQTGLVPLDHLDFEADIPVIDGLQAQGDLIVVPSAMLAGVVSTPDRAGWTEVPPEGVVLLRGEDGGNPHTLVADPGVCRWIAGAHDRDRLALGLFEATAPVYLLHPEHGASGCAPGTYVVRRQRELSGRREVRLIAD
ncbi:hypothetical protein [Actinocorallia herbida]|nr:hypothetical protein [Actinocorallia herbida]